MAACRGPSAAQQQDATDLQVQGRGVSGVRGVQRAERVAGVGACDGSMQGSLKPGSPMIPGLLARVPSVRCFEAYVLRMRWSCVDVFRDVTFVFKFVFIRHVGDLGSSATSQEHAAFTMKLRGGGFRVLRRP